MSLFNISIINSCCEWAQGSSSVQQNSQYQFYVPQQQQLIYVQQQPIKETYVPPRVPVQINGYGHLTVITYTIAYLTGTANYVVSNLTYSQLLTTEIDH